MASDLPQHGSAQSDPRREGNAVAAPPEYHSQTHANVSFASGTPQPPGLLNRKKQRSSKTKTDKIVTKSISTPHLRDNIMSESEADKKRNKLGYQRISIACGTLRVLILQAPSSSRVWTARATVHPARASTMLTLRQLTAVVVRSDASSQRMTPNRDVTTAYV